MCLRRLFTQWVNVQAFQPQPIVQKWLSGAISGAFYKQPGQSAKGDVL